MLRTFHNDGYRAMTQTELLQFDLGDSAAVFVETRQAEDGIRRVGRSASGAVETGKRFEEAVGQIRPAAEALLESLRKLNTPEEICLEFGIKFNAKAGAIIASVDSEATFKVAISWKNRE